MREILKIILANKEVVLLGACVFTFFVTQILKLPIKHWTKKIGNETTRKLVNSVILLIPFIFGCLYEFLYSHCYLHEVFSIARGISYGMSGISLYACVERFFGVKKPKNVYKDTNAGKAVVEFVEKVAKDDKVDEEDISAVKEFLKKVK